MRLSVGIVHWNTRSDLRSCLLALADFPLTDGDMEIIVVDNASTDGAPAMVTSEFPGVRLIANHQNRCYAEATNQAMDVSTGERLLWLNPDARVTSGALDTLMAFLDTHPGIGAVAPRLVWPDGRTQRSVRDFPTPGRFLRDALKLPGGSLLPRFDYETAGPAPQPMASCLMLTRESWSAVGPMDSRFPLYFNDVDWCLRAKVRGVAIWYTPDATVVHDHGGTTQHVKRAAVWESRRAWLRFWAKHCEGNPWRKLAAPLLVLDAWRRTGRWGESLEKDGGETTPEDWARAIANTQTLEDKNHADHDGVVGQ